MLFTYPNLVSGKTGYTPSAGRCLVTSAKMNNLHLTIVTINDANHYETERVLYDEMFHKYQKTNILSKESFSLQYPGLYIKNNLFYPLKNNEKKDINIKLIMNDNNNEIKVFLKNKEVLKERVYQEEKESNINKKNLFVKLKNFFKKIF